MNRTILLSAVAALFMLAGCAAPAIAPSEAANQSSTVESIELGQDDGPLIHLTVLENAQQNNEICTYNPAVGVTTCSNNWHDATIQQVEVQHNGEEFHTFDDGPYNGETLTLQVPHESGEYWFHFYSAENGESVFSVQVTQDEDTGKLELTEAGYDDSY